MTMPDASKTGRPHAAERVSYYFAAHEDDWQLFMNPSAFLDVIEPGTRTVFVHLTAGDGGLGTKTGGRKHPYYVAREHGAESAIRFMADLDREPTEKTSAPAMHNGHPIHRVSYRDTVAYFLRLPDGSPSGDGYRDTGFQSLKNLAEGRIDGLRAIDRTSEYRGWKDLVATIRDVINFERGNACSVNIHIPELDAVLNPNDHSDHGMTARVARDAVENLGGIRVTHHLGYACADRRENLSGYDRDMKCAVYAVTLAAVMAFDHGTAWRHYDQAYVARDYCRIEDSRNKTAS